MKEKFSLWGTTVVAGSCAGVATDLVLFPLDTIKTRLQSELGFRKTGGFSGIYKGIGSAATGSAPTAASFLLTYELCKHTFGDNPLTHSLAASVGEVVCCLIRVPSEVVKQRAQARQNMTSFKALAETIKYEGFRGLYRGYMITVMREIPFSFLQFPLWEFIKKEWARLQNHEVSGWQSGVVGVFSGGTAAAVTTPLDVLKTRMILAEKNNVILKMNPLQIIGHIARNDGWRGLFAGIVPRVVWIGIGGFIYLGIYDGVKLSLTNRSNLKENIHRDCRS